MAYSHTRRRTTQSEGSGTGDLLSTNNLSDLTSAATARSNLGLGTAATTNTTAYATAAQGTTADGAAQKTANLSDLANAATAFANIKQAATTSATGVVELATDGESSAGVVVQGNDARLSNARTPTTHASSHISGGGDSIKLDDLATPDDNTDLDASAARHGLLPKLSGTTTTFLRGDGSWGTPSGASVSTVEPSLTLGWRGTFTITDAAITPSSKLNVWQAPGPYTGKGTRADEAEMDQVTCIAYPGSGTATVYWRTQTMLSTVFKDVSGNQTVGSGNTQHGNPNLNIPVQRILGRVRGNVKFNYMVV